MAPIFYLKRVVGAIAGYQTLLLVAELKDDLYK